MHRKAPFFNNVNFFGGLYDSIKPCHVIYLESIGFLHIVITH